LGEEGLTKKLGSASGAGFDAQLASEAFHHGAQGLQFGLKAGLLGSEFSTQLGHLGFQVGWRAT